MRWSKGATQGSVIVGGNGEGSQSNQLNRPKGLSFDRHGNLYVVDNGNHRVQKFNNNLHTGVSTQLRPLFTELFSGMI
jgi:DNA-binding beta-propeller fold protein YncE